MTYEECEQLVVAFEQATLLKEKLQDNDLRTMAGTCANSIGDFIASMMAQAWKRGCGMSFFNGFDMADFDAYDAGYGHRPRRRRRSFPYFWFTSRKNARNWHINSNIRRGVWFTGEPITDMTDEHLANALALCRRKGYENYIKALEGEIERRKAVVE